MAVASRARELLGLALLSAAAAPLSASSASPCTAAASVGECWDSGCVLAPLDASVASPARVEAGHFWPPLLAPDGKQGFRGGEAVLEATVTFLPKSSTYMMYNEACDAIQNAAYGLGGQLCVPWDDAQASTCQISYNKLFGRSTCGRVDHHKDSARFVWRAPQDCAVLDPPKVVGPAPDCPYAGTVELGAYTYSASNTPMSQPGTLFKPFETRVAINQTLHYRISLGQQEHVYSLYDSAGALLETQATQLIDQCENYAEGPTDLGLYFGGRCHAPQRVEIAYGWQCVAPVQSTAASPREHLRRRSSADLTQESTAQM